MSLTPVRVEILLFLAELRFLSLPQLAKLCCLPERQDLAEKSARRHMRALFDGGLVDVLPVSRAALAPPGTPNDASLLYGSAPNVYALTARGLETLHRAGLTDRQVDGRKIPAYGPKNSLFLAHELAVRDVRVWFECCARENSHTLERWEDGEAAAIPLGDPSISRFARPDAWFAYRMWRVVLVGLVEVDRGTERGDRRWAEKLEAYDILFLGGRLQQTTGYTNARVLVVAPNASRRDALAALIHRQAAPALASRFWLTTWDRLPDSVPSSRAWRRPGVADCVPLV